MTLNHSISNYLISNVATRVKSTVEFVAYRLLEKREEILRLWRSETNALVVAHA